MVRTLGIFFILSMGVLLSSCDNYFGERTNLDFIEIPTYDVREISYVPIAPNIQDAIAPVDVYIGYDEFIYVVDSAQDLILRYDIALNLQGSIFVPGVRKIIQTRSFDLLAIGTFDTTITGVDYSLTALYEIEWLAATMYCPCKGQQLNRSLCTLSILKTASHLRTQK